MCSLASADGWGLWRQPCGGRGRNGRVVGGRGAQVGGDGGAGTTPRAPGTWLVSQGSRALLCVQSADACWTPLGIGC